MRDFYDDIPAQNRARRYRKKRRRNRIFLVLCFAVIVVVGLAVPNILSKLHSAIQAGPTAALVTPGKGNNTVTGQAGSLENGLQNLVKQYPDAQKIIDQKEQYPAELLQLLVRNPETLQFILDYPKNRNAAHSSADISSDLKKGKIPTFRQWDERWGYDRYGDGIIAVTGCGPTSLSMVAAGLTGNKSYTPLSIAKFADKNGYYVNGSGSSWKLMSEGAAKLGLSAAELPLNENRMKKELKSGHPIICSMHPGDFTTSGHFIVLAGVASNGEFIVHDPNSIARSNKTWSYSKLSPQIANLWAYSK